MTTSDADELLCHYCQTYKPTAEFRRRKRGDDSRRVHQCSTCFAAAMRKYRADRKGKKLSQFAKRASRTSDPRLLSTFVGLSLRQFGGVERLAEMFAEYVRTSPPNLAMRGFNAYCNLLIAAETLNPPPDPRRMSTEDLECELEHYLRRAGYQQVKNPTSQAIS